MGLDTGPIGRPCDEDSDCDDGVPCTRDLCDEGGCRNPTDPGVCNDGIFCNGFELCDSLMGCVPGLAQSCNDDDVCTFDACDEAGKICRHSPRDFDEDGEADWHCEGGTDCDDRDPTRGAASAEICGDGIDNDCDEFVDESECGRPMYDDCSGPFDLGGGGSFVLSNEGARPDYALSCGGGGRKDVVAQFTITEAKDVDIEANGTGVTAVSLRTVCTSGVSEVECQSGFPGQVRARSLPAGTYYVVISDSAIGEIELRADILDASAPPANESCSAPHDLGAGGVISGSFVDVEDDLSSSCGFAGAPDLVYQFAVDTTQNVRISAVSSTGDTLSYTVRSACDDAGTEIQCARGSPAGAELHELAAGTYFLIVEGPTFREVDFDLDVQFLPSMPAPAGDRCTAPVALEPGIATLGSLADKQDDLETSCGFFYKDMVYSFDLSSRSDVTLTVDGGGTFMYASVRTDCSDLGSALRCTSGNPVRARLRDLAPGTYYVVVESFRGASFNITAEVSAPTPITAVSGNDACATAHVVPATGGLFSGDTTTLMNDYEAICGGTARSNDAVFRLDLTVTKHVTASTDGSAFDTVLHLHEGACVSGGGLACDDDGGEPPASLLERDLSPGNYFFIVDGFGSSSAGAYNFELQIADP